MKCMNKTAAVTEDFFTWEIACHSSRCWHRKGKPESETLPSIPMPVIAVCVAVTGGYSSGEVHVRLCCRLIRSINKAVKGCFRT